MKDKIVDLIKQGKSQKDIATLLGVSRQRIHCLEKRHNLQRNIIEYKKEIKCLICSKVFLAYPKRNRKFCSFECFMEKSTDKCSTCGGTSEYKNSICRKCNANRSREYGKTLKGKESRRKSRITQQKKFPHKIEARLKLNYAVKCGKVKKLPCFCSELKVDAHHPDYSKPLDVVWLCRLHHKQLHKKLV